MKDCVYCEEEFEPTCFHMKYCNKKCVIRAHYIKRMYGVSNKLEAEKIKKDLRDRGVSVFKVYKHREKNFSNQKINNGQCSLCKKPLKFSSPYKLYCSKCKKGVRYRYYMYNNVKRSAHMRKIPFELESADIIVPKICPILGIDIEIGGRYRYNSPTVDRIDNSEGYVKENIQIISMSANGLKSDMPIDVWEEYIKLIPFLHKVSTTLYIKRHR